MNGLLFISKKELISTDKEKILKYYVRLKKKKSLLQMATGLVCHAICDKILMTDIR